MQEYVGIKMKRLKKPTLSDKKRQHGNAENYRRARKEKLRKEAGQALNKELNK